MEPDGPDWFLRLPGGTRRHSKERRGQSGRRLESGTSRRYDGLVGRRGGAGRPSATGGHTITSARDHDDQWDAAPGVPGPPGRHDESRLEPGGRRGARGDDKPHGGGNLHVAPFRFDVTPPIGHSCCGGWITPVTAVDDPLEAIGFVLRAPATRSSSAPSTGPACSTSARRLAVGAGRGRRHDARPRGRAVRPPARRPDGLPGGRADRRGAGRPAADRRPDFSPAASTRPGGRRRGPQAARPVDAGSPPARRRSREVASNRRVDRDAAGTSGRCGSSSTDPAPAACPRA